MGDQMEAPGTLHPLVCTPEPHCTPSPRYGPFSCFGPTKAPVGLKGPKHENRLYFGLGLRWGPGVYTRGWRGFHLVPHAFPSIPQQFRDILKIDFFDPGPRKSVKSARAPPWETVRGVGLERRPTPPRRAAAAPDPGHRVGRPPKRGGPAPCPDPTGHPVLGKSLHYYLLLLLLLLLVVLLVPSPPYFPPIPACSAARAPPPAPEANGARGTSPA